MKSIKPYSLVAENEVRAFWKANGIPKTSREKNRGKKKFYMMDGPPYASGHIHMGTALNKVLKDIAMRSKRMQGFDVWDKPGYDTHGLPIENKVEAKLGFKNKKQIEEFGVENFVNECKKYATEFIGVMNAEFDDLGVWMDWEHPYLTLENKYIEGLWWVFKQASEQGLLYLGKYSVHVCPRCETAVAYNEIEYVKQTDDSVFVKFAVKGKANEFFIIWTTTPWTLPGNAGIMVNPSAEYVKVAVGSEQWIIAKKLAPQLMQKLKLDSKVVEEFLGKTLLGVQYSNPLLPNLALGKIENAYRVIPSEKYVNLEEGTGLVHTAPGHGKEDFEEGTANGLPVISPVGLNGVFFQIAGKYAGKKAREANAEIISDLKNMGALVLLEKYKHDYPTCWRCKTPLLMIASPQWFFSITRLRNRLKALNEEVFWVPTYGKARFGNWLDSLGDWPVSRQRYWGTPLPIWLCDKCDDKTVVGSLDELKKHAKIPHDLDLHKPHVDNVTFKCKCGGTKKRVPEVLDVWFDSGSSSWSSLGYPKEKGLFEKYWPADLNIEGKDQIRGWWNSQLISSAIAFNKKPFNSIVMHGLVLDVNKNKMSKSLGNIITPTEVIEKQNRDYLRHFLALESRGEDFSFDWNAFKDINRFYTTFYNVVNYLYTYANEKDLALQKAPNLKAEDKWILSKLDSLIEAYEKNFAEYNFSKAVSLVEFFLLEEVSRTYIQIVRDRFSEGTGEGVAFALREIVFSLLFLLAPVSPHLCEHFYQQVKWPSMPKSVHLGSVPQKKGFFDQSLEDEVSLAKEVGQAALNCRDEAKLRRRWPLKRLLVKADGKSLLRSGDLIASIANVKSVLQVEVVPQGKFVQKDLGHFSVYLDISTDTDLEEEWELMELRRLIQEQRKKAGLMPGEKARLLIESDDKEFLDRYKGQIEKETNTKAEPAFGTREKLYKRSFYVKVEK